MSMNIVVPNVYLGSTDQFYPVWKLTRAMKAAGWVYKGSSDGVNHDGGKETTGAAHLDRWGPGGLVNGVQLGSQTGSGATFTGVTPTSYFITISGLSNMLNPTSIGHFLQLSGSSTGYFNGTFPIVGWISSSSVVIYNTNALSSSMSTESGLTWSERVSGSGSASSITWSAISNGREQIISGLSGMTSSSAGHFIKLEGSSNSNNNGTFAILSYISSSSVKIINNNTGAGADTSASGYWIETDPLLDTYPSNTTLFQFTAWITFQGPSTVRIPINAASTGTFIKGESVSESGSGATGELLGYQWEPTLSLGYMIVMPRKIGTGSGVKGWQTSTSSVITGASSGATVSTSASHVPQEFVREIVFSRYNNINAGHIHNQCVDASSESTSRFTYLMGTTATYNSAPGNSGFPTAGSYSAKYQSNWFSYSTTTALGRFHIMAVNAEHTDGQSADGTFTLAVGYPAQNPGAFLGIGFYRLDNTEDGDVDPYVWFMPNNTSNYAEYRAASTCGNPPNNNDMFSSYGQNGVTWWKGWRRRGFSTNDHFQAFAAGTLSPTGSSQTNWIYNYSPDNDYVATSLSPYPPKVRDPIWIISGQISPGVSGQAYGKMRKGTLRWAFIIAGGNGCDTYDGRKWIQLSGINGSWVLGPWDGVTSPLQV